MQPNCILRATWSLRCWLLKLVALPVLAVLWPLIWLRDLGDLREIRELKLADPNHPRSVPVPVPVEAPTPARPRPEPAMWGTWRQRGGVEIRYMADRHLKHVAQGMLRGAWSDGRKLTPQENACEEAIRAEVNRRGLYIWKWG